MNKEDILSKCTVDGMVVKLPPIQLERKLYQEVAKSLELIGGKWKGGKISGFVFNEPPTDLLVQITKGIKRDLKKEYQFFPTPESLASKMVKMAEIEEYDLILEPSAGQGAIINAIQNSRNTLVHYCELMELNLSILAKMPNTIFLKENFLLLSTPTLFHKIIANPPFSQNQDIQHIMHMWNALAPGGRIVTISSRHWEFANNKKETAFRRFLHDHKACIEPIAEGSFKESGTSISANLIVLDKPHFSE